MTRTPAQYAKDEKIISWVYTTAAIFLFILWIIGHNPLNLVLSAFFVFNTMWARRRYKRWENLL